jgi:hypothetical protein
MRFAICCSEWSGLPLLTSHRQSEIFKSTAPQAGAVLAVGGPEREFMVWNLVRAMCWSTSFAAVAATAVMPFQSFAQQSYALATAQGKEARVARYAQWDESCGPREPPTIKVRNPPAHGSVEIRPEPVMIANPPRVGRADCRGQQVPGIALYYLPTVGFVGDDRFDWTVALTTSVLNDTAVITVK